MSASATIAPSSDRMMGVMQSATRPARETCAERGSVPVPAAAAALVDPLTGDDDSYRTQEDPEVEPPRPVLDVPEVELDPLVPAQLRAAVDLRPARQPRADREPAALALGVLRDLDLDRRAGADDRHVAAQHVDEVRQLVDREAA